MRRSALVPSLFLVAAASALTVLNAADVVPRNLQRITEFQLSDLLERPDSMIGQEMKFKATFCQFADLNDVLHTWFKPEHFANAVVWDDREPLWEGQARTRIVTSLYLPRARFDAKKLGALKKYQQVEIAGRIREVVDGVPQIEVLEIIPARDPGAFSDQSIYHLEQAVALVKDDKRDLAEDHFASAAAYPLPLAAAIDVAVLRGRNLLKDGKPDQAEPVLAEAFGKLAKDRDRTPAESSLLVSLLAKAQVERAEAKNDDGLRTTAVANARQALQLDPSNGEALAVLGIGLAGLKQFDEARRACDQAVRLRPSDAETRWYLGRILDQQGRGDESIEALKKAIDLTPKDHRIHLAIAAAYHHRGKQGGASAPGDLALALQEYDISLRLDPNNVEVISASAGVIEDAADAGVEVRVGGNRVPATRFLAYTRYNDALAVDPKHVPSLIGAGQLAIRMGRFDEATTLIGRLREVGATADADALSQALEQAKATQPAAKAPASKPTPAVAVAKPETKPVEAPVPMPEAETALPPAAPVEVENLEPAKPGNPDSPTALPEATPEAIEKPDAVPPVPAP